MSGSTCEVHEEEFKEVRTISTNLQEVVTDVKWLRRIGGGWFKVVGSFIVLMVPMLAGLMIWLAGIDKRLTLLEQRVDQIVRTSTNDRLPMAVPVSLPRR